MLVKGGDFGMAMLKKWLLTSLMAVVLVFVSFANTVHITFAEGKTAKLAIIGESQKGIMLCPKEVSIEDGETAFSLLQKVMGDKVTSESMSFGTYIKGIDGLMAGATSGWLYDVNDKSAEVGADSYKLESGDVVAFRYVADWSNMSQQTLQQTLDKFGTCKTVEEPKPEEPKTEKPDGKPEEPKTEKPDGKPEEPKTEKPDGKPDGKPEDKVTEQPKQEKVEIPAAQLNEAISKTSEKMLQDGIGSDWVAIGLARSGVNVPLETKINYVKPVAEKVKKRLNRFSATDLARTIIMMNAMNVDPTKVEGQNLVQNLFESDKVNSVTGYAFTLLALDTKKYEVPAEAKWNRAALVQALLQAQHTDGGWTYDSSSSKESASNVDVTSMVLAALAPYQDQADVKPAIQKAVDYLYKQQLGNGGFAADGQENSNSTAQAIIGLSLVKDVDHDRLNKAVQNLMSYQLPNGEFKWLPSDQKGSGMATEQAFLALLQFKDLGKSIYDWSNVVENEIDTKPIVEPETTVEEKEVVEQPKQQEELQKQPKDENLKVVVDNERVNKETNKNKNQLPQTGASSHSAATEVGMGVLCIASAYVLWRRKAA
ncbi:LPXTG-motif cell wall anchor domain protein [Bacillus mycoides]|uniref:LPXTG-motif cell wall anchor domain protein n=2 Tax=Bacillus mycoides TaxID=1405 RepID=C2XWC7_BACMY|nr:LPXTG-motif cell wall anchor domain protein [Bacillus mycoides]